MSDYSITPAIHAKTPYRPKPVTPSRATLDQIIANQYDYAAKDSDDAEAHLRMAKTLEAMRDEIFPWDPRDRCLFGGSL